MHAHVYIVYITLLNSIMLITFVICIHKFYLYTLWYTEYTVPAKSLETELQKLLSSMLL